MGRYDQSKAWLARAKNVLPCNGAQTLSKASDRNPKNYPAYIDRGEGSHVWCVDNHEYVDWMAALGPALLGYAHPKVTEAVITQLRKGTLFSLEGTLVVEVAELLTSLIPGAETVRFVKSGSSATSAAVRAARTYTGREMVLVASNSFHGSDNYFQVTQKGRGEYGVPTNEAENILQFAYNDTAELAWALETCRESGKPVAAVLIEPARTFTATNEFLRGARKLCDEHGALLLFDEVVTFGRANGLTWAAHSGVTPDLLCLGKALGNGMPIGAVVGHRSAMDAFDTCFISGTYNGELSALAAAKVVLEILSTERVVDHITKQGYTLMSGFRAAMDRYDVPHEAEGIPVCWRQTFKGDKAEQLRLLFMQECALRGVLPGGICYPMYAHTDEDVRRTVQVYYEVAGVLEAFMEFSSPDLFFAEV